MTTLDEALRTAVREELRTAVREELAAVLAEHLDGAAPRLERLLTFRHAGELLDCSADLVAQLVGRGELERVQVSEQSPRVTAASVAALIARGRGEDVPTATVRPSATYRSPVRPGGEGRPAEAVA